MQMMRSPGRCHRSRPLSAVAVAFLAAQALAGCATSSSSPSTGSATSGDITWWGWTPTVQGAQAYIKAFNQAYPNIHVTFKEITIAGYDAAMRPALASSVSANLQQAIGVASTTVAAGSATPAQAAATLEKTMKSQPS